MKKRTGAEGFSLLELIVFIVVAGIFIPMAYIAFMAASRSSLNPEGVVIARFLAEQKLEDITKDTFDKLQPPQSVFGPVPGHAGYQWRWTIEDLAYQGRLSHGAPILATPEMWQAGAVYRVGDYVRPTGTPSTVRFYRCVPRDRWSSNTSYAPNSYVSPTAPNNRSYRATPRPLGSFPAWQAGRSYVMGEYVVPTVPNGHSYRCAVSGISAGVEPMPWPLAGSVSDGTVTWVEDTNSLTSGSTEPFPWPLNPGDTCLDGSIMWLTEQLQTAPSEPTWPSLRSSTVNDGSLRWQESTTYKHITVYIREPKGYEYVAQTLVTARPGAYP